MSSGSTREEEGDERSGKHADVAKDRLERLVQNVCAAFPLEGLRWWREKHALDILYSCTQHQQISIERLFDPAQAGNAQSSAPRQAG